MHMIMISAVLHLLLLVSLPLSTSSSSQGNKLIAIKESWGASLPSWSLSTDPCKGWEGVACNEQGEIIHLNLTNKGLSGPMPEELGTLTSLTYLDLGHSIWTGGIRNRITGDVSPVESLTNLVLLNLSYNPLDSKFPDAVLKSINLVHLRIDNAFLTGPFPTEISSLKNLKHLYLGNNSMTGSLPRSLGSLVNLIDLSLWNNPFNSEIPVELSKLVELNYLNLHNCSLWGGLPPEFSNLRSLVRLHLYNNFLTGAVPDSWKNLENLYELRMQWNYLTKTFPVWLLQLPKLKILDLSQNRLYGPLPNFMNASLQKITLNCNYFEGAWPAAVANMMLSYNGNCFSNVTIGNDSSQYFCTRTYSCTGFFQHLTDGCPPCPIQQFETDARQCLCEEVTEVENQHKEKKAAIGKILGFLSGAFTLLLLVLLLLAFWKKRSRRFMLSGHDKCFSVRGLDDHWDVPKGLQKFTFQELARATSNFHKDCEVGVGSFGKVFFGVLDNGKRVAVKRASLSHLQGSSEFRTEVILLSRLHHRNLVRLEGLCEDGGMQVLVYEYVTNGNLHMWLFNDKVDSANNWFKRLDIAHGIARGLDYLHSSADPPVIHRDVKPSNILLDENLVAKVSDFGLSKVSPGFETHLSTAPAGTAGYIDPEYFLRRQLTTASDVYSYGVLLLELITGEKAIDGERTEEENLAEWARPRFEKEGIFGIIDPRLGNDFPVYIYQDVAQLALRCASFDKMKRPSMQEVVSILERHLRSLWDAKMLHSNSRKPSSEDENRFVTSNTSSADCAAALWESEVSVVVPR